MERGWQRRWRRENEEMGDGPTWLNKEGAQWLPFSLRAQGNLTNSVSCFRNQSRIPDGDLRRVGGGE